jgi:hypothetical protein
MKTVADPFAETLAAAGLKWIYGIVGDSLNGSAGKHTGGITVDEWQRDRADGEADQRPDAR